MWCSKTLQAQIAHHTGPSQQQGTMALLTLQGASPAGASLLLRSTAQVSAPVVAEPCVLNLHDLAPDLPKDLLPPLVCLIEVPALCCQVWPFGFGSLGFVLLALQEPVEHRLGLLLITGHAALVSPGEGQATEQLKSVSAATQLLGRSIS